MNKDTFIGLLLMAGILFGFMYWNRPDPTKQPEGAQKATTEQQAQAATLSVLDTLTAGDFTALKQIAVAMGKSDAAAPAKHQYTNGSISLTADSAGVQGQVKVGDKAVNLSQLASLNNDLDPKLREQSVKQVRDMMAKLGKYKEFAQYLDGADTTVTLRNNVLDLQISTRGGMISSATLLDPKYTSEVGGKKHQVKLFSPETGSYSFDLVTKDQSLNTAEFNFVPQLLGDSAVLMRLDLGQGVMWGLKYTLLPDQYLVKMEVVQQGIKAVLPPSTSTMAMNWHQKMMRNELGRTFEERNSALTYKIQGETPEEMSAQKAETENLKGAVKWVAFKNQFFSSVIIPRNTFTSADLQSEPLEKDPDFVKDMSMRANMSYNTTDGTVAAFDFFFGPNDYPMLSDLDDAIPGEHDLQLNRLVPLGWGLFRWINQILVIPVFDFLGNFISNYGIIILLLTIFIKVILFPFTLKSFKSQAKMRVLAPEIKEINEKYPGQENAMKRSQETMALYSRAGASPMSGCLPMLLQMPVLIALFSFFPSAIELRGQSFLWAHDLSAPDVIATLPFSIPFYGNKVSLFCLLMTAVNIIYTRINMQNQPGGNSMPGMKVMMYMMPLMFLFFFNDYASGLSYYYFISLLITIIQTYAVRKFVDEKKVRAQMLENAKKPRKKSGWMARLEEAQRQQQAAMRAQQNKGKRR